MSAILNILLAIMPIASFDATATALALVEVERNCAAIYPAVEPLAASGRGNGIPQPPVIATTWLLFTNPENCPGCRAVEADLPRLKAALGMTPEIVPLGDPRWAAYRITQWPTSVLIRGHNAVRVIGYPTSAGPLGYQRLMQQAAGRIK